MQRRRPPDTATGDYVLHDFRRIDWDAWRAADQSTQSAVLEEARNFLADAADTDGQLAYYSILGHEADLLILALRPTLGELDTFQRRFEKLSLAAFTERRSSAVGPTEASGYTEGAKAFFDPDQEANEGLTRYMNTRLYPTIPACEFISYYPMSKRRDPDANWYDLPYEERAEHVSNHGDIGKEYAGKVTQLITGTIGFEEWEWGVTLFAEDMVDIKELLTEMRYDPSTSRYAEFGPFYVGRRFAIDALPEFMAGDSLPAFDGSKPVGDSQQSEIDRDRLDIDIPIDAHLVIAESEAAPEKIESELDGLSSNFDHYDSHEGTTVTNDEGQSIVVSGWDTASAADTAAGFLADLPGVSGYQIVGGENTSTQTASTDDRAATEIRETLADHDIYTGTPHGEDLHALVVYSQRSPNELQQTIADLRDRFGRHDSHVETTLYNGTTTDRTAVVSLWTTEAGAERAGVALGDVPAIESRAGEESGFGTMGMFYRVKPDYREAFLDTFDDVGAVLSDMEGHFETDLMINVAEECDMFIASQWRSKEDAMAFFRSDAFSDTVQWGRDVLEDRPRHVFLA